MQTSELITVIGSAASAIATVLLAILTAKYVKLTHALVEEAKAAKRPNVYVDLEFETSEVKLLIGNTGTSSAYNLKIEVEDAIPWSKLGNRPAGFASLSIIENGLKYLAPGRTLKFHAGYIDKDQDFFAAGSEVKIALSYQTESGISMSQNLTIDLPSYSGVLFESFLNPEREVARAITKAEEDRFSRETTKNTMTQMFKAVCPSCSERISSKAKKCHHCLEFLPITDVSASV